MSLHIIKQINKNKCNKLINLIYINFIHLNDPELMHNKKEITRLIISSLTKICFIILNKKIVAYLIGETKELNDGRKVFYINYLFTAKQFREKGFAGSLLKYIDKYAKQKYYDGIMLTCNTEDQKVYNYYLMKGFMPDHILRKYNKYDILYKQI